MTFFSNSSNSFPGIYSRKLFYSLIICLGTIGGVNGQNLSKPDEATSDAPDHQRIESLKSSVHIISNAENGLNVEDSVKNLLDMYYYNQFRHSQDPKAPYFMFLSKKGNLAMGIGGDVKVRGFYDWNGSVPSNGFSPYLIPIPKDPTSMRRLSANASGTGLVFTVLGNDEKLGKYMVYFNADFSGYQNRGFKLKKAYITLGDWTAGLATTTFEDTSAEPETVDGAGANGVTGHSDVLVRYMHTFKGKWTVAGSVEFPGSAISADGTYTKACSDYVPDFAAFGQYQWNGGASHVRLSGLLRTLAYRDLTEDRNYSLLGWAVQFSTVFKILPQLNAYGIVSVGEGHESYTTDLGIDNFDLIPDPHQKGKLYAPKAAGYVVGLKYFILPNLYSDLCLSEQRYYPKDNPGDGEYKYGLYGALNLFWDITPRFQVGLEYLAGKRMNFNGSHGSANRLLGMMMISF